MRFRDITKSKTQRESRSMNLGLWVAGNVFFQIDSLVVFSFCSSFYFDYLNCNKKEKKNLRCFVFTSEAFFFFHCTRLSKHIQLFLVCNLYRYVLIWCALFALIFLYKKDEQYLTVQFSHVKMKDDTEHEILKCDNSFVEEIIAITMLLLHFLKWSDGLYLVK